MRAALVAVVAVAAFAAGCAPSTARVESGAPCSTWGEVRCVDERTSLACLDGAWSPWLAGIPCVSGGCPGGNGCPCRPAATWLSSCSFCGYGGALEVGHCVYDAGPPPGLDGGRDAGACADELEIRCQSATEIDVCIDGRWEHSSAWTPSPVVCAPGSCTTTPEHVGCPCTTTLSCPWSDSTWGLRCVEGRWTLGTDLCGDDAGVAGGA